MKRINKIRVNNFAGMIKMTDSGETLIKKCQRILDEGEPLTDGAPMIYTPKQAGVKPECNVRADKWDIAMKAMDRVGHFDHSGKVVHSDFVNTFHIIRMVFV
jgi:hypothetical protein